ncbi:hypothetical protein BH18ACT5_BH18ACT5_14530 [soil metagenome]
MNPRERKTDKIAAPNPGCQGEEHHSADRSRTKTRPRYGSTVENLTGGRERESGREHTSTRTWGN